MSTFNNNNNYVDDDDDDDGVIPQNDKTRVFA